MFGDSFGQIQSNRLRRNEQEVSNYFRALDEGQRLAALDEGFRRGDIADRNADRSYFQNVENNRLDRARIDENTKYNRGFNEREFDWKKARSADELDWHKANTALNTDVQAEKVLREQFALAEQEAMDGQFEPEKYTGVLRPVQIQQLSRLSTRARIAPDQSYNFFKNAADLRNKDEQLAMDEAGTRGDIALAPSEKKDFIQKIAAYSPAGYFPSLLSGAKVVARMAGSDYFSGPDENTPTKESISYDVLQPTLDERATIKTALDKFNSQKNLESGLTKDPETGKWRVTAVPSWRQEYFNPAPAAPAGVIVVKSRAERDALPEGTRYVGPDGKTYTKQ